MAPLAASPALTRLSLVAGAALASSSSPAAAHSAAARAPGLLVGVSAERCAEAGAAPEGTLSAGPDVRRRTLKRRKVDRDEHEASAGEHTAATTRQDLQRAGATSNGATGRLAVSSGAANARTPPSALPNDDARSAVASMPACSVRRPAPLPALRPAYSSRSSRPDGADSTSTPSCAPSPALDTPAERALGAVAHVPQPSPAAEKADLTSSSSASSSSSSPLPRRSKSPGPPRPPSPYGEINALARHPTLYEPLLKPRFPIVLCHGLYGFDVRGPGFFRLHYWGDLLKILRGKIGAEVYVTAVPGTGSVKNRAHVLHKALEDTQSLLNRDINFVAHSMGGLDARYLISNIRPTLYRPRSLTTLCTPHRGSEFMAWCRANIGIGTEYEGNEVLNLRPSVSASLDEPDDVSIPLPYSLKAPLLSREQVLAAKKAAEAAKQAESKAEKAKKDSTLLLPGLPFNLSASVTGYLLDLLDSPAYANLAPSFLRDVFNPSTPDRPDVKYYSIAARTDKLPIWHPLWLPKLVLDGAESARVAQGCAAPPEWRGNDGLVSLESARWGEFLGTFDACDHWEMRGSSGLSSAEASKAAVEEATRSEIRDTREPREGGRAEKVAGGPGADSSGASAKGKEGKDKGWQWQDVYALVGKLVGAGNGSDKKKEAVAAAVKAAAPSPAAAEAVIKREEEKAKKDESPDAEGLASAASWIIRQLPGNSVGPSSSTSSSSALAGALPSAVAARDPASPGAKVESPNLSSASPLSSVSSTVTSAAATVGDSIVHNPATRMLYGAPGLSSSASDKTRDAGRSTKPDKFSLERMVVALCRKLHNDGF
ncbi:hypothetical protein JCM3770_001408 [Rhodotorula araucariae]